MRGGNYKVINCGDSFQFPQLPPIKCDPNNLCSQTQKSKQRKIRNQVENSPYFGKQSQNSSIGEALVNNKQINQSPSLLNLNSKNLLKIKHKTYAEKLKEVESCSSLDTFQHSLSPDKRDKNDHNRKAGALPESQEGSRLFSPKKYNNYITSTSYNPNNIRIQKNQEKIKNAALDSRVLEKESIHVKLIDGLSQLHHDMLNVSKIEQNSHSEQKSKRLWSPGSYISSKSPQKLEKSTFQSQRIHIQNKKVKKIIPSIQISKIHNHCIHSHNLIKKGKKNQTNCQKENSKQTIDSLGQIKSVPKFLNQKKQKPHNRILPLNQVVNLNVLTNSQQPIIASLQILKLLAENQSTTAYLVREVHTNFLYCLKKCEVRNDPKQFELLMREGKYGAKLNHPSVLKTYCTLYDKQNIYQLMQYMESSTLFQKTHEQRCNLSKKKSSKSSPYETKIKSIKLIVGYLLEAAVYMHSQGIIHRDIKPSNIFIAHDNVLKIGDFGSCGFLGSRDYVGTLDYVTPEVLLRKKYDQKVDVWSIGCIAYELWVGTPPFYHQQRQTTISNIIEKDFDKRKIENPNFLNLLIKLLQKDASKRITAAQALAHPFLKSFLQHSE